MKREKTNFKRRKRKNGSRRVREKDEERGVGSKTVEKFKSVDENVNERK